MIRVGELLGQKPSKAAKEKYRTRLFKAYGDNILLIGQQYGVDSEEFMLSQLELEGGPCPKCGMVWGRVDVAENDFFPAHHYYQAKCQCYPLCVHCLKPIWHHTAVPRRFRRYKEKLLRADTCPNCGLPYGVEMWEIENRYKERKKKSRGRPK